MNLLKNKSSSIPNLETGKKHPDDELLFLSKNNNWPVLTVDKKLKQRLHEINCKVIHVVNGKRIELIE